MVHWIRQWTLTQASVIDLSKSNMRVFDGLQNSINASENAPAYRWHGAYRLLHVWKCVVKAIFVVVFQNK